MEKEIKKTESFQTDSKEILEFYNNNDNYLIEEGTSKNHETNYCAIYFSSHDIYYPNTPLAFQNQLVKRNRFEWYGSRINIASKHIFIRDIKKQWYLSGINSEINSIEKMFNFLKKETEKYEVITVGSSAGGFAAMLFGQLLNASKVISFNGQTQLFDLLQNSNKETNPLVFRFVNHPNINKFYSIKEYIKKPETIFYFYSNKSDWDLIQYNHVAEIPINFISFNTNHHGIPFLKSSVSEVINLSNQQLEKFTYANHNPFIFSAKIEGWLNAIKSVYNQLTLKIKKKLNK